MQSQYTPTYWEIEKEAIDKMKYLVRLDMETKGTYRIDQTEWVDKIGDWFYQNGMYLEYKPENTIEAHAVNGKFMGQILLTVQYQSCMVYEEKDNTGSFFLDLQQKKETGI